MPEDNDDLLPIILKKDSLELSFPAPVSMGTNFDEQKEIETQMANQLIEALYLSLTKAKSVSGVCRTVDQIFGAIRERRNIMCRPYGYQSKNAKGSTIELFD